ncbi:MAG: OmpA family protein [Turneriella sp.]|nr:OmpA family protein [Turneriella sp.]
MKKSRTITVSIIAFFVFACAGTKENTIDSSEAAEAAQMGRNLKEKFKEDIAAGNMEVLERNGIVFLYIHDTFAFKPNSAELTAAFKGKLKNLTDEFARAPGSIIRVEGHTATGAMSLADLKKYPTSWELGAARSVAVVRYLQENCGIQPARLVALSFGAYRPIASNGSEAGKSKNRRVEISLVKKGLLYSSTAD